MKASLAPMAGYTDSAFRRICGEFGADYAVSEMISAKALCMRDRKTAELAKIGEGEPPVVLQIFGHRASRVFLEETREVELREPAVLCDEIQR